MLLAYPGAVTWQVIMQGVGSGMSAIATIVVGRVIDATFGTGHVAEILLPLGLLCALMILGIAGETTSMGMTQVGIARVVHNTRLFLTARLLRSRDIRHSPGTILSTVDTDTKTCADVREITAFPVIMIGYLIGATVGIAPISLTIALLLPVGALLTASAAVFLAVRAETQIFNTMLFFNDIQEGMTRLGRAVALAKLYTPTGQRTAPDLEKPADVTIRGLEFSYPDTTEPVLPTLDLTLAAGTTTALVGASGAGKSTLAALMSGLLRPTAGTITVGDVDIAQVSDVWTARNVTLISQEVHIFSGMLRDDLRMAAPTVTDGELLDALAAVGLPENGTAFRRAFPLGLDTQVGAGAVPLMPEVQQQIALARVLLRNPHVLILDEATSEAGSDQAHTLEAAAELVTRGRTALVVAHRLDQAVVADRIIVMDAGRIIEDGRHADLVAAGGRYAQLFARWSGQDHTM